MKTLKYISFILLIFLVYSCLSDDIFRENKVAVNEHQVRCYIQVPPEKEIISSRSSSNSDFSKLNVLVYDENNKFLAEAKLISQNPQFVAAENAYEIILSLPVTGELATLVFIANKDYLEPIELGSTLEELYSTLTFSFEGKWGGGKSSLVPMWGEIKEVKLDENLNVAYPNTKLRVSLLRAMARLDVKTDVAPSTFQPQSGHVFLSLSSGLVIPQSVNYDPSNNKVIAPSVQPSTPYNVGVGEPTLDIDQALKSPLSYTLSEDNEELMFIPEELAEEKGDSNLFIVIGGLYSGEVTPSYYKISLGEATNNSAFNILRNHHYILHIKSIKGPGYSTIDKAVISPASNIEVEIVEWDDNVNDGYVFGNKFFGIDDTPLYFDSPEAGQMKYIPFQTNLSDGFLSSNLNYALVDSKSEDFEVEMNYETKQFEITTHDNITRQPLKAALSISILDREFIIPIEQHPGDFDYYIDCEATQVYGAYVPNLALTKDNYAEVHVYADKAITDTYYKIYTNTIDGISFSGEGSLNLTKDKEGRYSQTLRLQGQGVPKTQFSKYLDVFMNTTQLQSCDFLVKMAYSPKKIVGASYHNSSGYVMDDSYSMDFRLSEYNFGLLPNSFVKSYPLTQFTQVPGNADKISNPLLAKALIDADILLIGSTSEGQSNSEYYAERAKMIADFLRAKGVVVFMEQSKGGIEYLFKELYGDGFQLIYQSAKGQTRFPLTSIPGDPILNGPFGDVNNKYWGQSTYTPMGIGGVPNEDIVIYSYAAKNTSDTQVENMGVAIFRHLKYNLFFIGSSGFISSDPKDPTDPRNTAFLIDLNDHYRPITRQGFGSTDPGPVDNSIFFGNVMNWALDQAEFNGKNSTPY